MASTDEADAKLLFDRHSQHHAWRAQQWWDRLPVLADVDRDGLIAAAHAGGRGRCGRAGGARQHRGPPGRRLPGGAAPSGGGLPRPPVAADPTSDGSAIRTLDLLLPDVAGDWREGEVLLQALLTDEAGVGRAAAAVASLERTLVAPSAPS